EAAEAHDPFAGLGADLGESEPEDDFGGLLDSHEVAGEAVEAAEAHDPFAGLGADLGESEPEDDFGGLLDSQEAAEAHDPFAGLGLPEPEDDFSGLLDSQEEAVKLAAHDPFADLGADLSVSEPDDDFSGLLGSQDEAVKASEAAEAHDPFADLGADLSVSEPDDEALPLMPSSIPADDLIIGEATPDGLAEEATREWRGPGIKEELTKEWQREAPKAASLTPLPSALEGLIIPDEFDMPNIAEMVAASAPVPPPAPMRGGLDLLSRPASIEDEKEDLSFVSALLEGRDESISEGSTVMTGFGGFDDDVDEQEEIAEIDFDDDIIEIEEVDFEEFEEDEGDGLLLPSRPQPPIPVDQDDEFRLVDESLGGSMEEPLAAPMSPEELLNKGLEDLQFFIENGFLDDARERLEELRGVAPDHPALEEKAAQLALLEEGLEDAHSLLEGFEMQLDGLRAPEDVRGSLISELDEGDSMHFDLGVAFKEMGQLKKAIGAFEAASKSASRRPEALRLMALCYMDRGEPAQAVAALKRALASPNLRHEDAMGLRAEQVRCLEAQGESEAAAAERAFIIAHGGEALLRGPRSF
ncbi:tetratricopeptide repeat protein, partial [Myxococcota bacterium]|nr:tetratricopeptide repeat protein [Myxococcota bacterium]